MDLSTIRKKLDGAAYRELQEFCDDCRLIFDNAVLYNGTENPVGAYAQTMRSVFEGDWKRVQQDVAQEEEATRKGCEETCALCGNGKLLFEPVAYYCNGTACNGARIRRNSPFYCDAQNKYHWCQTCFGGLKRGEPIEVADVTLQKSDLLKKKNDEEAPEKWVGCDECPRWFHQICALFNDRRNQHETTVYHCPFCILDVRTKLDQKKATTSVKGAAHIPHTRASAFIEARVRSVVAQQQARPQAEGVGGKRGSGGGGGSNTGEPLPAVGELHVRQLSNLKDKTHAVRPRMYEAFKEQGFPQEFPVTTKCICLFQEIDGVDVLLFGMYLYEYGHKAPQPNHRRVYVSYLDSVQYFRPRELRTVVYHEVLAAYLAFAKARGFHTCHIWACPPVKGDDYIFFCHPEQQRVPKEDRLRLWYIAMLQKCEAEGTVLKLTNLYDEYFSAPGSRAAAVPYFEGDHWVSEAEATLKVKNKRIVRVCVCFICGVGCCCGF